MFDFTIEIVRSGSGMRSTERFSTASSFLMACENEDKPASSFSFEDEVIEVKYGGEESVPPMNHIWTVWDLYCWMCSQECDWFN